MNQSEKYIKQSCGFRTAVNVPQSNAPPQYADRRRQYMAPRTVKFDAERAKYATDYVSAAVQGLTPDFYEWTETTVRLAENLDASAKVVKRTDDYKEILFDSERIDYFPIGAKIKTMGSTWICTMPSNMSSARCTALITRCNASYNSYDDYGNVITEPIIAESYAMQANADVKGQNVMLPEGYFNITAQLNENTRRLGHNMRIVLGTKPYRITGFTDFMQEFSGNRDSCHLLKFTVRIEEPNITDDVTENFIAGGNAYSFTAEISGNMDLAIGKPSYLNAIFRVNGEAKSPDDMPLTWKWASSDEETATVSESGLVTGIKAGTAVITATLLQNPNVSAAAEVTISTNGEENLQFRGAVPRSIKQYTDAILNATGFDGGFSTARPVTWLFSGALPECYSITPIASDDILNSIADANAGNGILTHSYSAGDEYTGSQLQIADSGSLIQYSDDARYAVASLEIKSGELMGISNAVKISCLKSSTVPLTVTAVCGNRQISTTIELEGY